jgi:hypothetical protein
MLGMIGLVLGNAALAGAMLLLAWMALGEYQKLFRANPRLVMSLEVFSVMAEIGGPGYLAAILAFCGTWLLMIATIVGISAVYAIFA